MDHVVNGIADEKCPFILGGESSSLVNRNPAGRGKVADFRFVNVKRMCSDGKERRGRPVVRERLHCRLDRQERVAQQVVTLNHDMPHVVVVPLGKTIPPSVEGVSELRISCDWLQLSLVPFV